MQAAALDNLVSANPSAAAAAILAMANADPRTVTAIPGDALRVWMTTGGIGSRLTRSAATIASTGDVADADQLTDFVSYARNGADFDSTNPTYAAQVQSLAAPLIAMNDQSPTLGLSQAEVSSLIAMGGGYLLFDVMADDVTASIARVAAASAFANLRALVAADFAPALSAMQAAQAAFVSPSAQNNARGQKINAIQEVGGTAPADLAALDALIAGGG